MLTGLGVGTLLGLSLGWRYAVLIPAFLGLMVVALPLTTPTTGQLYGLRTAQRVGRTLGLVVVVGSLLISVWVGRLENREGAIRPGISAR